MAEPKFTPGPWESEQSVSPDGRPLSEYDIVGAAEPDTPGYYVATVYRPADARLIAAAPEVCDALADCLRMLEAVRYSAGLGKGQMERVAKAKAALAKATGEGG